MYKALAYKEWLKVRWFTLGAFVLEVLALTYIFANLRAVGEFNNAVMIWSSIVYKKYMFFGVLKYLPLLIGVAIAVAQYLPEILDMKLKLTFHLPLEENRILLFLNLFGTSILFTLFVPLLIILSIGSSVLFPNEVVVAMFLTVIPWFLAGFLAYFFVSSIMIEPAWGRRLVLLIVGALLESELLLDTGYGSFQPIIAPLILIVLLFNYSHMLSGLRFKRGAK